MCLLVESLKIQERNPQNLDGHNVRLNRSRKELFGLQGAIDLRNILNIPGDLNEGVYKCRVIYKKTIHKIEFIPYTSRVVRTLELVDGSNINYEHKYLDRSNLDLLKNRSKADDILIVKEGRITDAYSANVVFSDGTSWLTPAQPLLKGTKRQLLLDNDIIREEDIKASDLKIFQKAVLINAMLDFSPVIFIPIESIFQY